MNKAYPLWLPLALLVALLPAHAKAEAELFPATEVTASYDVWAIAKNLWATATAARQTPAPAEKDEAKDDTQPEATQTATKADAGMADLTLAQGLADIEPAAGHGGEEKAEGGHEAPSAHGKTEGQKSFSGKVIGTPPPLPTVTIGGQAVITNAQRNAKEIAETTPDGLKGSTMQELLERRFAVTPYAHSPHMGKPDAPIKVMEFVDLSCGQCMPELAKIDLTLAAISDSVVVTHIHAPTTRFQDTNLPAFYAKIANKDGKFWVFRDNLIKDKPIDANAIFDELVKSGMSVPDARAAMLNEARRFYRELDADSLLARTFGIGKPPVLFVNGIRVGEAGIPLDKLEDVIKYVQARIKRGLPEPPK